MSTVTAVEAKGEKAAILITDDGQRIWTPEKDKADELLGKPIPSDWTLKEGNYGPQAFPPREKKGFGGGAPAAFRNTKDGQAAEQRSIHASVALQHAISLRPNGTNADILKVADELYAWLQRTSGGSAVPTSTTPPAAASPPVPTADEGRGKSQSKREPREAARAPEPAQGKLGEGEPAPTGACDHIDNSPLKPDGSALPNGFLRCLGCGVVHK